VGRIGRSGLGLAALAASASLCVAALARAQSAVPQADPTQDSPPETEPAQDSQLLTKTGLIAGARIGYARGLGTASGSTSQSDVFPSAIPLELELFYELSREWLAGIYFSYGFVQPASQTDDEDPDAPAEDPPSTSWLKYGLELQYHTSRIDGFDPCCICKYPLKL